MTDLLQQAIQAQQKQDLTLAKKLLDQILKENPQHVSATLQMGSLLAQARHFQVAEKYFDQALILQPNLKSQSCDWFFDLGIAAFYAGVFGKVHDHGKAIEDIKQAIQFFNRVENKKLLENALINSFLLNHHMRWYLEAKRCLDDLEGIASSWDRLNFYKKTLLLQSENQQGRGKAKLLVHLGYPKTATTWLQDVFFPSLPGVSHLGESFVELRAKDGTALPACGLPTFLSSSECTLGNEQFESQVFCEHLQNNISKEGVFILSEEALAYQIPQTCYRLREVQKQLDLDLFLCLTIRHPADIAYSQYVQYLSSGIWEGQPVYKDVLNWAGHCIENKINVFDYDYFKSYQSCCDLVGSSHVLVWVFETLFDKNHQSLSRFLEWLTIDMPKDLQQEMIGFQATNVKDVEFKKSIDEINTDKNEIGQKICQTLALSSKKLDESLNLQLKDLSYY